MVAIPEWMQVDNDRLLTATETCQLLGLKSERTLRLWRQAGEGPRSVQLNGRTSVRYRLGDVREWIAGQATAGVP